LAARLYEEIAHAGITGARAREPAAQAGGANRDVPEYVFRNLGVCYSQLIGLAKTDADRVREPRYAARALLEARCGSRTHKGHADSDGE
jgi:hypothetical protein